MSQPLVVGSAGIRPPCPLTSLAAGKLLEGRSRALTTYLAVAGDLESPINFYQQSRYHRRAKKKHNLKSIRESHPRIGLTFRIQATFDFNQTDKIYTIAKLLLIVVETRTLRKAIATMATRGAPASLPAKVTSAPPNQTLYVKNIPDKISKEALRIELYMLFSAYGSVLDVVALKSKMRGQAHIVYKDIQTATLAMRALEGFEFLGKKLVSYCQSSLVSIL